MYQDLVTQFHSGRHTKIKWARFRAVLFCLTPEETCRCIYELLMSEPDEYARNALTQKLEAGITSSGWRPYHEVLAQQLLTIFHDPAIRGRLLHDCSYVLAHLVVQAQVPQVFKNEVSGDLLASDDPYIRKQVYDTLRGAGSENYIEQLEAAWLTYADKLCARLIVQRAPKELLERHFTSLWELQDERTVIPLLLRVALTPERLDNVYSVDGITYAYICAKRGITIANDEARALWDRYASSEKATLLLWCFGELKLYNLLTALELKTTLRTPEPLVRLREI